MFVNKTKSVKEVKESRGDSIEFFCGILVTDKLFSAILDKSIRARAFWQKIANNKTQKQIIIKFKILMTKELPIYRSVYNGFVFLIVEI